jgi:hypothetical protein
LFTVQSFRSSTAYTGSDGARIEWRAVDAIDAVVALTEVDVRVSLATDRYPGPAPDTSVCCEEWRARRNVIRRELAAALRRARTDQESVARSERQERDDRTGDTARFRVLS